MRNNISRNYNSRLKCWQKAAIVVERSCRQKSWSRTRIKNNIKNRDQEQDQESCKGDPTESRPGTGHSKN